MKDIFKITKLYLLKYKVLIVIFWAIMLAITLANGSEFKENFRNSFANYKYYKQNNITHFTLKGEKIGNFDPIEQQKFVENFNEKISYSEIENLRQEYIYASYLDRYTNSYIYLATATNILEDFKDYIDSEQYLTTEEIRFSLKLPTLISQLQTEYSDIQINASELSGNDKEWKNKWDKIYGITDEINKNFPSYINNPEASKLISFLYVNFFTKENINIAPMLFDYNYVFLYFLVLILFSAIFFALEYHSQFGKFIATLPIKKNNIYFGKILASLIAVLGIFLFISLANIWIVKTSVFSEIISSWNAFSAFYKVYLIILFFILLGAIFSSFSGSMVSIIALYLPAMLSIGYPYLLFIKIYAVEIFGEKPYYLEDIGERIFGENSSPIYVPAKFLTEYQDISYFYYFIIILIILCILCSFIYDRHNIDLEGYFFTNKAANYICLTIAIISFATLPSIFLIKIGLNNILSLIISYLLTTPFLIFIFKRKMRI